MQACDQLSSLLEKPQGSPKHLKIVILISLTLTLKLMHKYAIIYTCVLIHCTSLLVLSHHTKLFSNAFMKFLVFSNLNNILIFTTDASVYRTTKITLLVCR